MARPSLTLALLSASGPALLALSMIRLWLFANGDGPLDQMFFEANTGGLLVVGATVLAGMIAAVFLVLSARHVHFPSR